MKKKMAKALVLGTVLMGYLGLAACNTMEGLGEDVQKGGEKLENAADKNNK